MSGEPIFITRVNVAKGQDFAMIALGAPVGPLGTGAVEHAEILRVVMSYRTLKEVAELFARTVQEVEAAAVAARAKSAPPTKAVQSFADDREQPDPDIAVVMADPVLSTTH
jgi:hypothetical protein